MSLFRANPAAKPRRVPARTAIHLMRVGEVAEPLLEDLRQGLEQQLRVPCEILAEGLAPTFAFHEQRQQYNSSDILARLGERLDRGFSQHEANGEESFKPWRLLGVTELDLYIPILTFVFGEAQVGGRCAVVSTHRLRQEFFGLPPDEPLLRERLLKEAVHELGHTFALKHCEDYRCAMAAAHAVEWIDLKGSAFCSACSARVYAAAK